jgi:hypothetical protein
MQLQDLQELFSQNNIENALKKAGEDGPHEQFLAALSTNFKPNPILEIMVIPGLEDEIENARLLQFYVGFNINIDSSMKANILDFIAHINVYLPLPSFGYQEGNNSFYFKYVYPISKNNLQNDKKVIIEIYYLIAYLSDLYYPFIQALISGDISLEDAKLKTQVKV